MLVGVEEVVGVAVAALAGAGMVAVVAVVIVMCHTLFAAHIASVSNFTCSVLRSLNVFHMPLGNGPDHVLAQSCSM